MVTCCICEATVVNSSVRNWEEWNEYIGNQYWQLISFSRKRMKLWFLLILMVPTTFWCSNKIATIGPCLWTKILWTDASHWDEKIFKEDLKIKAPIKRAKYTWPLELAILFSCISDKANHVVEVSMESMRCVLFFVLMGRVLGLKCAYNFITLIS